MKSATRKWSWLRLSATVGCGVLLFFYAFALDGLARAFPPAHWHKVHQHIAVSVLVAFFGVCVMAYGLRSSKARRTEERTTSIRSEFSISAQRAT